MGQSRMVQPMPIRENFRRRHFLITLAATTAMALGIELYPWVRDEGIGIGTANSTRLFAPSFGSMTREPSRKAPEVRAMSKSEAARIRHVAVACHPERNGVESRDLSTSVTNGVGAPPTTWIPRLNSVALGMTTSRHYADR